MKKTEHVLYWEDVIERFIYAELDDYAWRTPEEFFGYTKQSTIYIYHDGKLAAFYHPVDSKAEANAGYEFYRIKENADRVIALKKEMWNKVERYQKAWVGLDLTKLSDDALRTAGLAALDLCVEAIGVHYLTQPQFFEKFEELEDTEHRDILDSLAHARFTYTRPGWTTSLQMCKPFLEEYGKRHGISLDEAEALLYEEIQSGEINKPLLVTRAVKFVMVSERHTITTYTGTDADEYIATYENYAGIDSVKGVIGNKGVTKGTAFVVSNENLDLKKLPVGMRKGMVLIIQNAWPEFEPYYEMASAIVTNEGGITSHGVVVARELGIPCIVGTKIATHVFKTGDMVEVNANAGTARKLT